MCSTAAQRIAEIGRAIDDLAVKAGPAAKATPAGGDALQPADGDSDLIVARLAELWALLAELDPEVGRRLAGYQNLPALNDLRHPHPPTDHLTDGWDWPSGRQKGAVPAATLRGDGPSKLGKSRPALTADDLHL